MDIAAKLLMNYYGRDRVVRTVSYIAMLAAGRSPPPLAAKFGTVATKLSAARTALRMFDDVLMYKHLTGYGWGREEKNPLLRVVTVLNNFSDTIFFPVEHVYWLGECGLLPVQAKRWMVAGIAIWATSLTLGVIKNLITLKVIQKKKAMLRGLKELEGSDEISGETISSLRKQERICKITIIKNLADLMNAINWLPAGFLWAGKFSMSWSGLFGIISSLLGLQLTFMTAPKPEKKSN